MYANLPDSFPRAVIINPNVGEDIVSFFEYKKIKVIFSSKVESILSSVAFHPDVQITHIEDDIYVCEPSLYDYYNKMLSEFKVTLLKGDKHLSGNYPEDIAYNIARVGMTSFQKTDSSDKVSISLLKDRGVRLIDVPQGYAKCNVCVLDESSLITSDVSVYKKAIENNIDALLIKPGGILLEEFPYGFIGGASFKLDNKTLCFMGDISHHPDYERIVAFAGMRNIMCKCISERKIEDFGSVIHIF